MSTPAAMPRPEQDQRRHRQLIIGAKYGYLTVGLALFSLGISLTVEAQLGLASWSVLHKALEDLTPLTFGQVSQIVGFLVIGVAWAMGSRPTLATFLNIILVGFFVDFDRAFVLATPATLWLQVVFLLVGVAVMGLGSGMYLSANLGAGPRDTLMIALVRRTGWPVGRLRSTLELSVMLVGWLIGGPVGYGTVVGATLTGPAVQSGLRLFERLESYPLLGEIIHVPIGRKGPRRSPQEV